MRHQEENIIVQHVKVSDGHINTYFTLWSEIYLWIDANKLNELNQLSYFLLTLY